VRRWRVLELFCGIGGCAAALAGRAEIVAAVDVNRRALSVYGANFEHPTLARAIEDFKGDALAEFDADVWWLSPPCQPYTRRGHQRDIDDPRAQSLLHLIQALPRVQPAYLALENVPPFATSRACGRLREALDRCGYAVNDFELCLSEFGWPNWRRRYYLVAGRLPLQPPPPLVPQCKTLAELINPGTNDAGCESLYVGEEFLRRYQESIHIVEARDPAAASHCFTSGYGHSPIRGGSYLRTQRGVRRFAPAEIIRLLGFPSSFKLPAAWPAKDLWPLVGRSLAVPVVAHVLGTITGWGE
jgi:site-specific DNA-cytosine methylase